ncbi:hypothetical protein M422DRAFT_56345 [Sphaerobolus stellatus SS14]|uniref:Transcriptional adapter 3 n=1 Tax=Sphaerobolus stellatus (strain SS14) TaxID=990650 RepID=A0A0C9T6N1_SPHS4|nr:hypothetical protein M422DRAFT_56345 [Sphaerobolus stellatus SS14]
MAHTFTPYPQVSTLRSQLLTNPPVSVPPVDDLLSLQEELQTLKSRSSGKVKKAENDIKVLEGLHRKYKDKERDREKGKVKDKARIKRENTGLWADCTAGCDYFAGVLDTPDSHSASGTVGTPTAMALGGYGVKTLPPSKAVPSKTVPNKTLPGTYSGIPPASGSLMKDKMRKEKDRQLLLEKERKKELKKKKRKREEDESDAEELERPKKLKRSPEPPLIPQKQKSPTKIHTPTTQQPSAPATATSFALPRHNPQIPQRPLPQPLPPPGPCSPCEVTDDFSKLKPPTQTSISTFWSYVEPWLRPIREEDVGLLEWDGDEETPFVIPPLGRHYTEIWDDEDSGRYPALSELASRPTPKTGELPRWDPLAIQESDLVSDKGHALGPVHERLLSAMLPVVLGADGKPAASSSKSVNGGSRLIDPLVVDEKIGKMRPFEGDKQPPKVNVQDMQERIVKELKSIGLLGEEEVINPDYSTCPDDPLAAELRQCQKDLRIQMTINKARRKRLAEIAKERLARNEFEEHTAALERSILAKYNTLQRRDMPKQAKKKKKAGGAGGGAHVVPDGPFQPPANLHPAAWGLEKSERVELGVDEELNGMVEMRQGFVEFVQPMLDAKERERPGLLYGTPKRSIYEDLEVLEVGREERGR